MPPHAPQCTATRGACSSRLAERPLRPPRAQLHDKGLSGEVQRRLGVDGSIAFSRLFFNYTSFNCGNRPFHLVAEIFSADPPLGGARNDLIAPDMTG
eukprot:4563926-Prymnesium_polylepis.1